MQDLVEQLLRRDLARSGLRSQQQAVRDDLRERDLNVLRHDIVPPLDVGNGLGHGKRNKQVGAVAGGLLGASIGHDLGGRSRAGGRSSGREVCETRYRISYREELVGYEVHYRHHGRRYQSRSRHHPGDRYWLGDDHRH